MKGRSNQSTSIRSSSQIHTIHLLQVKAEVGRAERPEDSNANAGNGVEHQTLKAAEIGSGEG